MEGDEVLPKENLLKNPEFWEFPKDSHHYNKINLQTESEMSDWTIFI
jgi:hypothetical protein